MVAKKGHILVLADALQKEERSLAGKTISTGTKYNENWREKNPVLAQVVEDNDEFEAGTWIICNYSYFDEGSPFLISDGLFAIPLDSEIYAAVDSEGIAFPVCGNVMIERVEQSYAIEMPEELRQNYPTRGIVVRDTLGFRKGDLIVFLPYSDLEMVYYWKGEEVRFVTMHIDQIAGIVK